MKTKEKEQMVELTLLEKKRTNGGRLIGPSVLPLLLAQYLAKKIFT